MGSTSSCSPLSAPPAASHPPRCRSGETVRVLVSNNNYHVDCYACEGCNTKLTDDSSSKCYPLGKHLLCYNCHMLWRKTGGVAQPITDL